MPINLTEILEKSNDVEYLKSFIEESNTNNTDKINMSRVASNIYLANTLSSSADELATQISLVHAQLRLSLG